LLRSVQIFRQDGIDTYSEILIDDEKRDQIIIGAKNYILRLKLSDFQVNEVLKWEPNTNEINSCRSKIQSLTECQNHIRVLSLIDNKLFVCGTFAYKPLCTWREPNSISSIISGVQGDQISGDGKCPYNSKFKSAYLALNNSEFYSGTSSEQIVGFSDVLIERSLSIQTKQLRTQQHDSNWLRNPYFVQIIEIDNYIYVFFRETALEHLACGTSVYSRVARLCKYDDGLMKYSDTFKTFSKVRINCSIEGDTTFYFNELETLYYDYQNKLIYAGFNAPKNGLLGAAVCIYDIENLTQVFSTPFLSQKSNESFWLPANDQKEDTEKCESHGSSSTSSFSTFIPGGIRPVLRSGLFRPSFKALELDSIRIGHLFVDTLIYKNQDKITILLVITLDGRLLRKYSLLNSMTKLCLVEEVSLKPKDISIQDWTVNKATFLQDSKELILTTPISVMKLSVVRCDRFNTSLLCMGAMDPYCMWDPNHQRCVLYTTVHRNYNIQTSWTCPILNLTIDGGLSPWSSWSQCQQSTGESCSCRTRTCTHPSPRFNGKQCEGITVEISKCEVHGGWSQWSLWTQCGQTCGKSYRSRFRTCTNPVPKYNGRVCVGSEREEEMCPEILCSQDGNKDIKMTAWSDWDTCSKRCGGGIQKRRRTCFGIENCQECTEETRICNETPCPIQQAYLWGEWIRLQSIVGGYTEKRIRYVCSSEPTLKADKVSYRVCRDYEGIPVDCEEKDSIDNLRYYEWTAWSTWSECYPPCSGGKQSRRRTCLGDKCLGNDLDQRDCPICQGGWSCWSDYSECLYTLNQCRLKRKTLSTNDFINDDVNKDYFQALTNPSPHTTDTDTFTKFRSLDSSSNGGGSATSNGGGGIYKEIPSRKLNMYINPRDMINPTTKRQSIMSSMKTNLDADDL
ncbi:unnamed protein product, partial [Didymodactylos carnosus]